MLRTRNPQLADAMEMGGIAFDQAMDFLPRVRLKEPVSGSMFGGLDGGRVRLAMDEFFGGAFDAANTNTYQQPTLVTNPNAGILSMLSTFIDPKLIEVILQPLKAELVYGVTKKGDWITQTAVFGVIENTGETASYGDFNENGRSDANVNWPQRQSYNFQTITEWGDMEVERMGLAKVDWAARKNLSSANTLNRFMNLLYFFGVSGGLQNYGGLNDPSLSAALTPATKAAGGTSWKNALPTEILADVQAGVAQLITQTGSNVDNESPMTLALHATSDLYMVNTNSFGLTAMEMINKALPNVKVVTAPQYLSGTTYSYQLIVDEIDGQRAAECAFNEKMRAHRIIPAMSSFRQKKSAGCWGTIIYRPIQIAAMSGI